MRPTSIPQKLVLSTAAVVTALRLLFPIAAETRYGTATDVPTTLLQLAGILVIFAAAYYLVSTGNIRNLRQALRDSLITLAWGAYLVSLVIGVERYGMARSLGTVQWFPTSLALALLISLIWFTWSLLHRDDEADGRRRRYGLIAILLVGALISAGYILQRQQDIREEVVRAKRIDIEKELDEIRYRIVEGQRIGPIELGMSLESVNRLLGRRFSSGQRLARGLNQYTWRSQGNGIDFWQVLFDSRSGKLVIVAYGLWIAPPASEADRLAAQRSVESMRFETTKGARFGDTPLTMEALYGKPDRVTRLRNRKDVVTLRFHYPSIRTEFQLSENAYGLLSVVIYAPGFSPDDVLRSDSPTER